MSFRLFVYRRVCAVDVLDRREGHFGMSRFEYLTGTEEDMRAFFAEFADNPQVLAAELLAEGKRVVARFDRLVDVLPEANPAACRAAVLSPDALKVVPSAPNTVPKEGDRGP